MTAETPLIGVSSDVREAYFETPLYLRQRLPKKTQPRAFGTYATCVVHSMVRLMVIRGNEIRDAIQRRRMSCEKWATLEIFTNVPVNVIMSRVVYLVL